jgi:multidrug transporter EmrE-like cation transporter
LAFIFGVTLFSETITIINIISIGMIASGIYLLYIPIRTEN